MRVREQLEVTRGATLEIQRRESVIRYAMVGSVVAGLLLTASPQEAAPALGHHDGVEITLPPSGLATCPEVSGQAYQSASNLFAAPEDRTVRAHLQVTELPSTINVNGTAKRLQLLKLQADIRAEVATKTGVTVYDPTDDIAELTSHLERENQSSDGPKKPVLPFAAYLDRAQQFAAQYGVHIALAAPDDYSARAVRLMPPQPASYENDSAKQTILRIMQALGEVPVEYIKIAQLQNIILYDSQGAPATGLARSEQHTIALSLGASDDNVRHETAHLAKDSMCGYAPQDPQFAAYSKGFSVQSAGQQAQPLMTERSQAFERRDLGSVCTLTTAIERINQRVDTFTDYGKVTSENSADGLSMMGKDILYWKALQPGAPASLKQQATHLLAQLHMAAPEVAEFFAAVTPKSNKQDPITVACVTGDWSRFTR